MIHISHEFSREKSTVVTCTIFRKFWVINLAKNFFGAEMIQISHNIQPTKEKTRKSYFNFFCP